MPFEPINLVRHPDFTRFEDASGLEYEVHGSEDRLRIGFEIAEDVATVHESAERLLKDFMRHPGQFELSYVDVFDAPDNDGASFSLRFHFTADADPHGFRYTYFDVCFTLNSPPSPRFWPIKFTVGFH